jgi:signal transduction histidine kinase
MMNPSDSTSESLIETREDLAVLVIAPAGRDSDLSCGMLGRSGLACIPCRSVAELMRQIDAGSGPAVIAAEAIDAEAAHRLGLLLDAQPAWSDLPLILFAGRGGLPYYMEDLARRRNTTVLHRPIQTTSFLTTIRAAVQNRLRQYEVRDLLEQLSDRTRQLQRLALQLTDAEERERDRLAGLLHDDLQQILAGANFHLEHFPQRIRKAGVETAVREVSALLKQAIEKSRSLSHDLSPPTLKQHGLSAALHWLADRMRQMHGLRVEVDARPDAEPADVFLKMFLFRSAQECLFNTVKHAGTDEARLELVPSSEGVRLCIRDEGAGFDPEEITSIDAPAGFGLFSIRERALLLGGRFEIQSAPGKGCVFRLIMPRQGAASPSDSADHESESMGSVEDAASPEADLVHPVLRVALVDDHQVMRSGLKALFSDEKGIEVVAEAEDGEQALKMAGRIHPDVILMDVAMPGVGGIEATRRIKARHPEIRIIGLSMFDDPETALRMREAGAEQYLSKTGSGETLLHAVRGPHQFPAN